MSWILSLLLSVLAQPTDVRADVPPQERRGVVGDYIRIGIGATTAHLESSPARYPNSTSRKQTEDDLCRLATCAASWSSYSLQATTNLGNVAVPYVAVTLINTTLVYGTGNVYTSYGKIPVASGEFTPTRTVQRMFNVSTQATSYKSTTYNPALVTQTPTCSFSPKDCSRLYVSYISSLGLPNNASVPQITPAPENSPRCPDYYYKPYSTSYASTQLGLTEDCKLYGNSVEVFYFPSQTGPEPTTPVTYVYEPGTTFTSPSIYLSFDYLSATRHIPLSVASYFESCGLDGCATEAVGGGEVLEHEGTIISGQILTMAPTDVSSMVVHYGAKESGVISTVVGNLRGYADVAQDIHLGAVVSESLTAERLRIEDLTHPPPRAYYLRPEGAPGCDPLIHNPECGTIFEGAYRAIISLPSAVSGLQGPWKTCNPAIYGVYDPPFALQEAASVDKPTLPAGYSPTPTPTTARPYTITPPLATPAKTALRVTLPSATRGELMHTESSLLVPSHVPSRGGRENGDVERPNSEISSGPGVGGVFEPTQGGTEDSGGNESSQGGNGADNGPVTAGTNGDINRHTASDGSETTPRSSTREPTDTLSGTSPSELPQSGGAAHLSATILPWLLPIGTIISALKS